MNKFNKMNDDELNSFVKQNQPRPPDAEPQELNLLKRKLNLEDKATELNSVWLWLVTGLAASVFIFQFLTTNLTITPEPAVTVAATTPTLIEEDDEFSEASAPTLDVGEDYLTLAGF